VRYSEEKVGVTSVLCENRKSSNEIKEWVRHIIKVVQSVLVRNYLYVVINIPVHLKHTTQITIQFLGLHTDCVWMLLINL